VVYTLSGTMSGDSDKCITDKIKRWNLWGVKT